MANPNPNPILEAAQEAYAAGLCPIRVRCDGSKRPLGEWRKYQHERPDQADLIPWFAHAEGFGIVTGEISGRVIMIELEARAIHLLTTIKAMLLAGGLGGIFDHWLEGYSERTPSGGLHLLVHVGGDDPLPGNEKLASDFEGDTLIETRGEGGFTIVAPSRGSTHPTGGSWERLMGSFESIAWATPEEFTQVCDVLRQCDQHRPRIIEAPPRAPSARLGETWFDEEKATLPPIHEILLQYGWQPSGGSDAYGEHWVRPGKDPRTGHSASLSHEAQRLYVHSTNSGLPTGKSLDAVDILLYYEWGVADPQLDDRTRYIVERRKARRPSTTGASAADRSAGPNPAPPSLNLPDEFWQARPYLAHVRQAAWAADVSPDAVWEATKAFYAATIHPQIRLPLNGTLDYISVMVGSSGAGKTVAKRTALGLFGPDFTRHERVILGAPGGSGEGMIEFYIDRSEGQQRIRLDGCGFYIDEGKWLLDVNSRLGNTSVQCLKQGWSGELTGSLAATSERNRFLKPGQVRMSVLIAIQPGVATEFLRNDLTEGGFPQRLSWGWSHPDSLPEELTPNPGELDVPLWTLEHWGTNYDPYGYRMMAYEPELTALVREARRAGVLGQESPYDGHDLLAMLKGAAILALMDDRKTVTMSDWALAQLDWNHGVSIREHLITTQMQGALDKDVAAGRSSARRKIAEDETYLDNAVATIATKCRYHDGPVTIREAKDHLRPYNRRYGIHHQDVITEALKRGAIVRCEGGITHP